MRAASSRDFARAWRRQSQRVTRRMLPWVMGFHPVSSQSGQASGRVELSNVRFMMFFFSLSTVLREVVAMQGVGVILLCRSCGGVGKAVGSGIGILSTRGESTAELRSAGRPRAAVPTWINLAPLVLAPLVRTAAHKGVS